MDHQFRNAALGGFNKQDVLDYLELTVRDHNAQTQTMQEQLDQVQAQCAQLMEQAEAHQAQVTRLQQENQQLNQTIAHLQEELERSRQDSRQLREQAREDADARSLLQAQVDKLLPDANAYIAVKERTAGVELDAHRRAQAVVDQAQAEAEQIHLKMEQWLAKMTREYADLRSQVDASISHCAGELSRVEEQLSQISRQLADQDTAVEQLEKGYARCEVVKIPAPLPIPEE